VLVFTHKERKVLDGNSPLITRLLTRLRERYVLGMYWGWYSPNTLPPAYIDFHLGHESSVTFSGDARVRRLPYHSSSFTPAAFRPRTEVPKQWDVMSVTRPLRAKHTGELLEALRLFLTARPNARALVLCLAPKELSNRDERDLAEQYERLFDAELRTRLSFVYMQGGPLRPFNRGDIAFLYAASRSFALFSSREGASRSIKEALACGLPVLVRKELEGGGLDFLSSANSRVFSDPKDAAEKLAELLDDPNVRHAAIAKEFEHLSEVHGIPRLQKDLDLVLQELGEVPGGEYRLHDLSIRLPSHDSREVPLELQHGLTADLMRPEDMARYLKFLVLDRPWAEIDLTPDELRDLDPPPTPKKRVQRAPASSSEKQSAPPAAKGTFFTRLSRFLAR